MLNQRETETGDPFKYFVEYNYININKKSANSVPTLPPTQAPSRNSVKERACGVNQCPNGTSGFAMVTH